MTSSHRGRGGDSERLCDSLRVTWLPQLRLCGGDVRAHIPTNRVSVSYVSGNMDLII